MKNRIIIFFIVFLGIVTVQSQSLNETLVRKYVDTYYPIAVSCGTQYHVPASILLAQALIYTKAGANHLAKEANNHMAVTCTKADVENRYHQDNNMDNICFKRYKSVEESYLDYLYKIKGNSLYSPFFQLSDTDYKGWANGLQKIGHSSNPSYGISLISIIETYKLNQYDSLSFSNITLEEVVLVEEPILIEEPVLVEMSIQVVIDSELMETYIDKKANTTDTVSPVAQKPLGKEDTMIIPLISKVYIISDLSNLETVYYPYTERPVYIMDGLKFILASRGDTFEKISKSVQLPETHLRLYNDLYEYKYQPIEGEVVYIQKKKSKVNVLYHTIEMGESLRYISQLYGIRLEKVLEKNAEENIGVGYILCISCKK